jgi:SAM-dependent methyltransferase/CheY-like chemotaxis protein
MLNELETDKAQGTTGDLRKKILVIDDDISILKGLRATLGGKYEVLLAENALQGLDLLSKDNYCIILDVKMREMNGFSAYPKLKAKNPDVPIIFFTAFQSEHDLVQVINKYKPEGYVEKGRDLSLLKNLVENAVKKYQLILENEAHSRIKTLLNFSTVSFCYETGRTLEDHQVAGNEEAERYIQGTSYPQNADYLLFSKELNLVFGLEGKMVAELCSGPGDLSKQISRYDPAYVMGIDGSEFMIRYSKSAHKKDNLEYLCADLLDLDQFPSHFDLVVCQNSIHHFDNQALEKFFRKSLALLKPGGFLYVADYRRELLSTDIFIQRLEATNVNVHEDLINTFKACSTKEELSNLLSVFKDLAHFEVYDPVKEFEMLKIDPEYSKIVEQDPHPHYLDYGLSLRVKGRKLN